MLRIIINLFLLTIFMALMTVVTLPISAEMRFNAARRLQFEELWEKAEQAYQSAIAIMPLSSSYLTGYGDFLWEMSYETERPEVFEKIESIYKRSTQVNPECFECWIKLGQFHLANGDVDDALGYFKTAIRKDPNGRDTFFWIQEASTTLLQTDFLYLKVVTDLLQNYVYSEAGSKWITNVYSEVERDAEEQQSYKLFLDELNRRKNSGANHVG